MMVLDVLMHKLLAMLRAKNSGRFLRHIFIKRHTILLTFGKGIAVEKGLSKPGTDTFGQRKGDATPVFPHNEPRFVICCFF